MEDTSIKTSVNIKDEDMTPTVKSFVVLDWLDAIMGPVLVEHVHGVYAKELETCTCRPECPFSRGFWMFHTKVVQLFKTCVM